jgi:CrcB protein
MAIAVGGAIGAILRYGVANGVYRLVGRDFPWGTLVVNVLGSLLMGLLFVLLLDRYALAPALRAGLLIGLLGAFTTFSTFSIETLNLIEQAAYWKAGLNMLVSVFACVGATWIGVIIARQI